MHGNRKGALCQNAPLLNPFAPDKTLTPAPKQVWLPRVINVAVCLFIYHTIRLAVVKNGVIRHVCFIYRAKEILHDLTELKIIRSGVRAVHAITNRHHVGISYIPAHVYRIRWQNERSIR